MICIYSLIELFYLVIKCVFHFIYKQTLNSCFFLLDHIIGLSTWQEWVKMACNTVMCITNYHMTHPPDNIEHGHKSALTDVNINILLEGN